MAKLNLFAKILITVINPLIILFPLSQVKAANESRAAVPFLLIHPGARSSGLGEAYTAIANDATGAYYNPAGIAQTKLICSQLYYTKWLPALCSDVYYLYLSSSLRTDYLPILGHGVFNLSFSLFNLGKQLMVTEYGVVHSCFYSYDYAFTVTYANNINRHLSLGISLKYIYSHLTNEAKGKALAVDIGLLYQSILPVLTLYHRGDIPHTITKFLEKRISPGISIGLSLSNLGPNMAYVEAGNAAPLPRNMRLGIAYNCIDTDSENLIFALDLYKPLVNDDPFYKGIFTAWGDESFSDEIRQVDIHIGSELTLLYLLSLRVGYISDRDGDFKSTTFGIGLGPETFRLNYAYVPAKHTPLENNHRLSLSLSF